MNLQQRIQRRLLDLTRRNLPPTVGDDYDQLVRQLVYDTRSQPKGRLKTEEEIAKEEKEAPEKAERARLRARKMRSLMRGKAATTTWW